MESDFKLTKKKKKMNSEQQQAFVEKIFDSSTPVADLKWEDSFNNNNENKTST
jgi:hypothetical protein